MTTETTTVVGAAAPAPATGPNDAALAAKYEAAQGGTPATPPADKPQRPADVPEKFWDAEKGEVRTAELLKSYSELEKAKGTEKAQKQEPTTTPPGEDGVKDALAEKGLKLDEFSAEMQSAGKLSEDSYKKLADAGFDRSVVDTYVRGWQSETTTLVAAATEAAGGADQLARVREWAVSNASEAEIEAFNKAIGTKDAAQIKMAVQAMTARYTAAEGTHAERRIEGGGNAGDAGEVYTSFAQVTADMKMPEYKRDPAFREKVKAKLARSAI